MEPSGGCRASRERLLYWGWGRPANDGVCECHVTLGRRVQRPMCFPSSGLRSNWVQAPRYRGMKDTRGIPSCSPGFCCATAVRHALDKHLALLYTASQITESPPSVRLCPKCGPLEILEMATGPAVAQVYPVTGS